MNCQVAGCGCPAVSVYEIDLPSAWEPTQNFTTLTVQASLCFQHGLEVARRVEALLEVRSDIPNLLTIIEAALDVAKEPPRFLAEALNAGDGTYRP
jgi:hypothetical protein